MKKDIPTMRGNTFSFSFIVDEEIDDARFTVKRTTEKDDTDYLLQKTIGNGISLINQEGSERTYIVRVAPEDTNDIAKGTYYYDLQIKINGDIFTPLIGKYKITDDVTREV